MDQVKMEELKSAKTGKTDSAEVLVTEVVPHATVPRSVPKRASHKDARLFFNRELSWLDFNWRVLYQAIDPRFPLLERVRFLSIAASNLDEFFRKRIGGLKRQAAAGVHKLSPDGRNPNEQLGLSRAAVLEMNRELSEAWEKILKPEMKARAGIRVLSYDGLTNAQREWLRDYFHSHIFPILTPLAVDPGHPFPFISNLSLSLAITLRHPKRDTEHFARLKVPTSRERWIRLEDGKGYVAVEQVIANNIQVAFSWGWMS